MLERPKTGEAAPYYSTYIDLVSSDNIVTFLEAQLEETLPFLSEISEDQSLHRYAPEKWSMRQLLNHVTDTERVFVFRAMWFARGFSDPLPSYDQNVGVEGARADAVPWAAHIEDFRQVRQATLTLFRNFPEQAWLRRGIASDNPFTVRALAYIVAGHVAHHTSILKQRYL
jgi:uncharacterized damage-inducible protein DinB